MAAEYIGRSPRNPEQHRFYMPISFCNDDDPNPEEAILHASRAELVAAIEAIDAVDGKPVTAESFLFAWVEAYAPYRLEEWAGLHSRAVLPDEIDEDPPAAARTGEP